VCNFSAPGLKTFDDARIFGWPPERLSGKFRGPGHFTCPNFSRPVPGNPGLTDQATAQHDLGRVLATESFQKFLHFARTWSGPFQFQASKLLTVRKN
jgi:hypothetical protein